MRSSRTRRLFAAAVAVFVAEACTNGDRCDDAHACNVGDVCFDGFCELGCQGEAVLIEPDVCQFALDTCDDVIGACVVGCLLEGDDAVIGGSQDGESGCPQGYQCTTNGSAARCLPAEASPVACQDDTGCEGVTVEVRR